MLGPMARRLVAAASTAGHLLRRSTALVALILAIALVTAVTILTGVRTFAQPPTPVDRFFGEVYLRPPIGSSITAAIGGNPCGDTTIQPGYKYVLDVVSAGQAPGCGTEGATVDFAVGGIPAGSATWHSGDLTPLTLPASPNLPPTPSPTTAPAEPTPTPAPGTWESVPLLQGCNPLAVTHADNTPAAAIGDAVFPETILRSIWKPDAASGHWRGYSPQFPEVTDLAQTEFLDAISICVTGPGVFARPLPGITPTPAPTILPTATPTPLPPVGEAVSLVGNACNDVTTTYADNTSVPWVIDPAVLPHGILNSIWEFKPSLGVWQGYSPQFPEVSDLVWTDFLDNISICVSAASVFIRPLTDIPPTPGPTLTPSSTPTPLPDSDLDGCTDSQEEAMSFDPLAWHDVCDVPIPAKPDAQGANGMRDGVVDIRDVLAVLFYAFAEPSCQAVTACGLASPPSSTPCCADNQNASGVDYDSDKNADTVADGLAYDRSAGVGPDPVTGVDPCGPPDNVVDIRDVLATLAQAFVVDCSETPLDLSGTWLLYTTPQGGAESGPDCSYVHQQGQDIYYQVWQHEWAVIVNGTITGGSLELSGEGTYYGDAIHYSASAATDGTTMTGTYSYSGAYTESGAWRAEKGECKKAKGWVRTVNIQNQGYWLDFDVWDLVPEGITFTSATVTGPHIGTITLHSEGATEYNPWGGHAFLGNTSPVAGEIYTFSVNYSDGASDTVTAVVRDTFVGFPIPISPSDGESVETSTPTFSWLAPACGCQGYYRLWVVDGQGNDMWSAYLPKETTSVVYNSDGTGAPLSAGETYEWRLIAFDQPISGGPDNNVWVVSDFTVQAGAP